MLPLCKRIFPKTLAKEEFRGNIKHADPVVFTPKPCPTVDVKALSNTKNDTMISVGFGLTTSSMLTYADQNCAYYKTRHLSYCTKLSLVPLLIVQVSNSSTGQNLFLSRKFHC